MANWISNKLKVAETLLQQIDQHAAESLKKGERSPRSDDQTNVPAKAGGSLPLKDQLQKKTQERNDSDYQGKLRSDLIVNPLNNSDESSYVTGLNNYSDRDKESSSTPKAAPRPPGSTLTDSDWTELLGTPNQPSNSLNRSNGVSGIRGLKRDCRRQGNPGSVFEGKRNQRTGTGVVTKSAPNVDKLLGNRFNGKPSDGEEFSSSSGRPSSAEMQNDGKNSKGQALNLKDTDVNLVVKQIDGGKEGSGRQFDSREIPIEDALLSGNKNKPLETMSKLGKVDGVFEVKKGVDGVYEELGTVNAKYGNRSSISDNLRRGSSISDEGSDYDTDSGSGSIPDSESEREKEQRRQRREKVLAEKAAAKAVQAIKEREDMVARLEGEKQSLEKILEERAKQQAQEASELQTSMMETMEAFEREKQKHNNTRMEAFVLLAKLETANADLARSLASAQKNLEAKTNRVTELGKKLEQKEVAQEDLRTRIIKTHQNGTNLNQLAASKGVQFEQKILEVEYSVIADKIRQLQDKAKKLEADIKMTQKEIDEPKEVELELKRRLGQLTDHLIQKQAQVESLSSEKATLLFRIEAVSRVLDDNKSMTTSSSSGDLESGKWEFSESKLRPLLKGKIRSGRKHLGSLLWQLDTIFLAGAVFLQRNPIAKLWALIYLVCFHFWVIYILMSPSQATYEEKSGAVISLENINYTAVK